jgi:hypothetical protein
MATPFSCRKNDPSFKKYVFVSTCFMRSTVSLWNFCASVCSVSYSGTLVNSATTLKLTNMSVSFKAIDWILCANVSEFFMWCSDCPTNGLSISASCFARLCVGEAIQFTIGLSGVSSLWIFGKPYSLGGTEAWGINFWLYHLGCRPFW